MIVVNLAAFSAIIFITGFLMGFIVGFKIAADASAKITYVPPGTFVLKNGEYHLVENIAHYD